MNKHVLIGGLTALLYASSPGAYAGEKANIKQVKKEFAAYLFSGFYYDAEKMADAISNLCKSGSATKPTTGFNPYDLTTPPEKKFEEVVRLLKHGGYGKTFTISEADRVDVSLLKGLYEGASQNYKKAGNAQMSEKYNFASKALEFILQNSAQIPKPK